MNYSGNIITKNQVQPTITSASGVWTLEDAENAATNGIWPIAGVPNPISRSLRFNSADSAYLNRTPASDTSSNKKGTFSCWMKVSSNSGTNGGTFIGAADGNYYGQFYNQSFYFGNATAYLNTAAIFRDYSAWYHVFFVFDTTLATANDRMQIWVNGVQQTVGSFNVQPTQNSSFIFLNTVQVYNIGRRPTPDTYFNGYLTEINFIDGQALTPSSFGMTDGSTGVWIPKKYTGTYGTNGFYLNFSDASTTVALGYDYSGNSNTWTTNNFSVTAGAGNDSLTDVPTLYTPYGFTSDTGGVLRGNYCTLNPLNNQATLVNGNLDSGTPSAIANWLPTSGTIGVSSGKWYWEVTMNSGQYLTVGIFPAPYRAVSGDYPGSSATAGYGYTSSNGNKFVLGTGSAYGATFTTNDVIGIAFDADGGTLTFYKNNVSQGTAASSISGTFVPGVAVYNNTGASTVAVCNFGQRPFAYTPPSGYKSLCTTNLSTPTIGATATTQASYYFNPVLYTGTGLALGVTGLNFQPDFVWLKSRSNALDHGLYDAVRGVQKQLISNTTGAETTETQGLTAFNGNGFTLGTLAQINTANATYVSWNWNAGGSNATNTSGTITSTVRANTTAGFSIVTYTGTGANATVGHGLGVALGMVIVKDRDATRSWNVWHSALSGTQYLLMETTDAAATDATKWNSTIPTSSVFSIGTAAGTNTNTEKYVAYCFAAVAGYSAFGSYTGNGSADGPFIYTGFRPRYVLVKCSSNASNWTIFDAVRNSYNPEDARIQPNLNNAEASGLNFADFVSNGFKVRGVDSDWNANTYTYVYAAFAESPFKYANAR